MSIAFPIERPDLESSTDDYARRFQGSVGSYFLEVQWKIVRSMLPPPGSCRVLDIGGGHAQLAAPMVQAGYDVTIVGSDDSCVARLDRAVGAKKYDYIVGDLLDLPWNPGASTSYWHFVCSLIWITGNDSLRSFAA
jgi:SAM-dependent methyltransferase